MTATTATVGKRRGKGTTPERRAREGALAGAINTILTAANSSGQTVAAGYREYDAIFMTHDDSHRADALLVLARQPGVAVTPPASLWVDDILFLQGECRAWAIEIPMGERSPEQLARAATFYASLHASAQPIRPLPLLLAADGAELDQVQVTWREAWPAGSWMVATVEGFATGLVQFYRDGVSIQRPIFSDAPVTGEVWRQ